MSEPERVNGPSRTEGYGGKALGCGGRHGRGLCVCVCGVCVCVRARACMCVEYLCVYTYCIVSMYTYWIVNILRVRDLQNGYRGLEGKLQGVLS